MSPAKKSDLPAAAGSPLTLTEEWEQVRFEALQESLQPAFEAAQEQLDETPVGFIAPAADEDPEAAVVVPDAPIESNILLNVGQLESADSDDSAPADVDNASNQSEVDADKDSDRKPDICNSADACQNASAPPAAKIASTASGSNASRNVIRNPVPAESRLQLVPNAVLKDNGQRIHAAMNPNSQPRSQYYRDHLYSARTPSSVSGQSASPTPPPITPTDQPRSQYYRDHLYSAPTPSSVSGPSASPTPPPVTPTDDAPVPAPPIRAGKNNNGQKIRLAMDWGNEPHVGSDHYRDHTRLPMRDAPTPSPVSGPSASPTPPPVTPTDGAPVPAPPIRASNNNGVTFAPAHLRYALSFRAQGGAAFVLEDPETMRVTLAQKAAAEAAKKTSGKGKGKGKAATQAVADLSNKRRRPFEDEDQEEEPAKRQRGKTSSA